MLEVGSGVDARLGDDVGAGLRLAKRQMRLDERALRVGASLDPVSNVCRLAGFVRCGNENEVNQLGQATVGRDSDQRAVCEKGVVHCYERILVIG